MAEKKRKKRNHFSKLMQKKLVGSFALVLFVLLGLNLRIVYITAKNGDNYALAFGEYRIPVQKPELETYVGKEVILGIRPEDIHAEESFLSISEASNIEANVDLAEMMGSEIYLYLTCAGQNLVARVPSRTGIKAEDHVKLALDTNKIHVFDAETEEIICH